ncbi:MAG: hypothetical protein AMXMBFR34_28810 [Myxococcaceae bacterium]
MLSGEDGGERAIDDGLTFGKQQQQLRPEGADGFVHDHASVGMGTPDSATPGGDFGRVVQGRWVRCGTSEGHRMASKDDYRQAAKKLKASLDEKHAAFMTFQLSAIEDALHGKAGTGSKASGNKSGAEMEAALLEEGLICYPPLTSPPTDGYVRLYRTGTMIANILNAIRYPGSGSDQDLANLITKVKTPKNLGVPPPAATIPSK